jgi:hypothetical protein
MGYRAADKGDRLFWTAAASEGDKPSTDLRSTLLDFGLDKLVYRAGIFVWRTAKKKNWNFFSLLSLEVQRSAHAPLRMPLCKSF